MPEIAFRKEALERLSSPDQLDERVHPIASKRWLLLLSLCVFFLFALFFCVFANIPLKVPATGILLMKGPGFELSTDHEGTLVQWNVAVGDNVTKGQLVGVVNDPSTHLVAEQDGQVLQIEVYPPAQITRGQKLILFSPQGDRTKDLVAYSFVDARDASRVSAGQRVEIAIPSERIEERGLLIGKVRSVSSLFLSEAAIANIVKIPGLAKAIMDQVGLLPHLVVVDLVPDSQSPSGYYWTGNDPRNALAPGLSFGASILVDENHPIDYVAPFFKRML